MTLGGIIILCCVLCVLALQLIGMVRGSRTDARIEAIESRVSRVEEAVSGGKIDRISVIAFRAELASQIAERINPLHKHLAEQDRMLAEIAAWQRARSKTLSAHA